VKFVRVQLELDFADLTIATAHPAPHNVVLRGEYYLQLPQSSTNLNNGAPALKMESTLSIFIRATHLIHA
jgi:hypothetical protein